MHIANLAVRPSLAGQYPQVIIIGGIQFGGSNLDCQTAKFNSPTKFNSPPNLTSRQYFHIYSNTQDDKWVLEMIKVRQATHVQCTLEVQ